MVGRRFMFIPLMFSLSGTSCSLTPDLIFDDRKSDIEKRAKHYEKRGYSKERSRNLATEDEVWSWDQPSETPRQLQRWVNPVYPD